MSSSREEDRPVGRASRFDRAWICRACELLFGRAPATGERDEAVLRRVSELGRPRCFRCTHEWRERTPSGRRSDLDLNRPDRERPG